VVEVKLGYRTVDLPYTIRVHGVTEEMFDEWVDEDTKAELFDGVMIVHSSVTLQHDDVAGFIRGLMRFFASAKNAGKVLGPHALVHLAACRLLAPDVFFIRERLPRPMTKVFESVPELALEILSPATWQYDLEEKRAAYREAGVREIWFVDVEGRKLIVDRKRGLGYVEKIVSRGKFASKVLDGFWLDVSWLWADPLPDDLECLRAILGE
jgi:Uma2 family endonuclease